MNDPILEKHCWAEIDLDALRHNYSFIKRTINGPVCAVVRIAKSWLWSRQMLMATGIS